MTCHQDPSLFDDDCSDREPLVDLPSSEEYPTDDEGGSCGGGSAEGGHRRPATASAALHPCVGSCLSLGHYVISEGADATDFDLDDVAWDHISVSPLGAHPEHVTGVERGVPAELLNPGCCVPDLVGR
jgi:hypothetical protein